MGANFRNFLLGLVVIICLWKSPNASVYHRYDQRLEDAMAFINAVQQPENCTGLDYLVVEMGINGGFAAQFQFAGKEWMHLFAAHNFSVPVLIQGRIIGYSDNKACDDVKRQWTCYFKPMSECEEVMRKTGRQITSDKPRRFSPVPTPFAKHGEAFWWGVVQFKMFQLQHVVIEHIHAQSTLMNRKIGFPFGLPLAGLHVRHGDKKIDGFKQHSMDEELNFLRKSPDCEVKNTAGDCFSPINTTSHSSMVVLHRLAKKHGIVLDRVNIDKFNRTSITNNAEIAVDPKSLWPSGPHVTHQQHRPPGQGHHGRNQSSSLGAGAGRNGTAQQAHGGLHRYVIPLQLFVASDDVNVLRSAAREGHLTNIVGVSQDTTTASDGMLKTLLSRPEIAHAATLEIISDIYFLSQCNSLIGISASQVFRMAVAIANVTGNLHFAAALDGDQIRRVQQLSTKYDVPFPEKFFLGRR